MAYYQRKVTRRNTQACVDSESTARAFFGKKRLELVPDFELRIGIGGRLKPHRFDLGDAIHKDVVQCKSPTCTHSWNVLSAKMSTWNETMNLFHAAPSKYKKILFVLRHYNPKRGQTLAAYHVTTSAHLFPCGAEACEYDTGHGTAKNILSDSAMKYDQSADRIGDPQSSREGLSMNNQDKWIFRLSEAAKMLQTLGICKANGPGGRINGPNCQRFGHRDSQSARWWWDVRELITEARRRRSSPPDVIAAIEKSYGLDRPSDADSVDSLSTAESWGRTLRSDLEKSFRDTVRELESRFRRGLPLKEPSADRRTLGNMIQEARTNNLLDLASLREAEFVNAVRNTMNHPNMGEVPDDRLKPATESARSLLRYLKG